MKTIIEIQELAAIRGGQITLDTSGQYDIGYIIGCGLASFAKLFGTIRIVYPYVL